MDFSYYISMKKNVVIVDSGLGGLSLIPTFLKELPFKNYIYFADNKNLPYGNKSKKELLKITINNIKYIKKKFKPFMIVFGCNTIGSTLYDEICKIYPELIIFSIKPNYDSLIKDENSLLIATSATINKLKDIYINKSNLDLCKMPLLASKIEKNINNLQVTYSYLKRRLEKYKPNVIILGCTHYYFIKNVLKNLFPNAHFIDGVEILTSQIKKFLKINNFKDFKNKKIKINVKLTKKDKCKKKYINIINNFLKCK